MKSNLNRIFHALRAHFPARRFSRKQLKARACACAKAHPNFHRFDHHGNDTAPWLDNNTQAVIYADLGGDEQRPGYVQPCGCVQYPAWTATHDGNSGTHYASWTDTWDCRDGHGS